MRNTWMCELRTTRWRTRSKHLGKTLTPSNQRRDLPLNVPYLQLATVERRFLRPSEKNRYHMGYSQQSRRLCPMCQLWFTRSQTLSLGNNMIFWRRRRNRCATKWLSSCMPCVNCKRQWIVRKKMSAYQRKSLRPARKNWRRQSTKWETNSSKIFLRHKASLMSKATRIRVSRLDIWLGCPGNHLVSGKLSRRLLVLALRDRNQTSNLGWIRTPILSQRKA